MPTEHHTIAILYEQTLLRQGMIRFVAEHEHLSVVADVGDVPAFKRAFGIGAPPDAVLVSTDTALANEGALMGWLMTAMPNAKVLVMGAEATAAVVASALCAGAHGFYCTHHTPDILLRAITAILLGALHFPDLPHGYLRRVWPPLTPREEAWLKLPLHETHADFLRAVRTHPDQSYEAIAVLLKVKPVTVEGYRAKLFKRFGLKKHAELIRLALVRGL